MRILPSVLLVTLLGCGSSTAPEPRLGDEFTVSIDGEVVILDTGLRIAFFDVTDDSRCPSTAICAWAGDASVVITSRFPMESPVLDTLHTTLDPKAVLRDGTEIRLVRLDPYPDGSPITRGLYSAVLVTRRILD